jgi:predicted phosphodiesterase
MFPINLNTEACMRIAFISDIHGHAIALEAVLSDIQKQKVDQIICLGDIATIGFQPRQVFSRLKALNCPTIMGNHDAALLKPEAATYYRIADNLLPTFHWCLKQLADEELDYLRTFSPTLKIPLSHEATLFCYHGSPDSNTDSIFATTPIEEIEQYYEGCLPDIMIGGHTHLQMARQHNRRWILNPGSVGNAFSTPYAPGSIPSLLPWAEYAILDWGEDGASFDCRRVYFDLSACRQAIRESGIPSQDWWLEQYPE